MKLNITFGYLAGILADDIPSLTENWVSLPELLILLREINRENIREEVRLSAFDPKTFYRIIGRVWIQGIDKDVEPRIVMSLIEILSREDSCRTLLRMLTEEQIVGLVPLVISEGSATG